MSGLGTPSNITTEEKAVLQDAIKDNNLSPNEAAAVKGVIAKLNPEEIKNLDEKMQEVFAAIIAELHPETVEVQGPVEYSMEGVRHLNQSEIFEMFFENPLMMGYLSSWIGEKTAAYPYLAEHKDTIELTVWKHLVEQMSFGGIMGYASGKITDYAAGKYNSIKEAMSSNPKEGSEAPAGIDKLTSLLESFEGVADAFSTGEGEGEKVAGFFENIMGFINDISDTYFNNITALDVLLKEKGYISESGTVLKPEIHTLLSNPYAISAIGKSGKFEGNGSSVQLGENGIIQIKTLSPDETKELQDTFITEVGALSSKNGEKIDGLRGKTKKIAKLLSKFGFDSESLSGFKEFLEGIPGVGVFLASLLGFFVSDSVISELDKIGMSDPQKKALESFEDFIQKSDNKEKLPFTLREKDPGNLSGKEVRKIRNFVEEIEKNTPGEDEVKKTEAKKLLEDPLFAEKVLTGVGIGAGDILMQQAHAAVKGLSTAGSKLTQEEFFKKLADIDLSPKDIDAGNTDEVLDEDFIGPRLPENTAPKLLDFSEALSFPLLYKSVEINYDSDEYILQVGEKSFKITNIAGLAINDAMLKTARPQIQLIGENIKISYSLIKEMSIDIDKSTLPVLLDQLIAGDEGTLTIDQSSTADAALMVLFSKID